MSTVFNIAWTFTSLFFKYFNAVSSTNNTFISVISSIIFLSSFSHLVLFQPYRFFVFFNASFLCLKFFLIYLCQIFRCLSLFFLYCCLRFIVIPSHNIELVCCASYFKCCAAGNTSIVDVILNFELLNASFKAQSYLSGFSFLSSLVMFLFCFLYLFFSSCFLKMVLLSN